MTHRAPWSAIRLGAAALTLAAGLASPALAQTWVGNQAFCTTPRHSLGTLCIDSHQATIWAEGNFLAQLADAFRCAGYNAYGDCGRLIVRLDCGTPRIRWTGCDYRLVIDRDGAALVITPLRVPAAPIYNPHPAPRPRIDFRIDLDPWDRRDDRDRRDWDDRRDDRDRRDWDDRRDDRDRRDWDDRRDDRDRRDWDDRRDDRTSGRDSGLRDGIDWRSFERDQDGRGYGGGSDRGIDNRRPDRNERDGSRSGGNASRDDAMRRSARLPDWSPGRSSEPSRIEQTDSILRRGEQTGSRPQNDRAGQREGGQGGMPRAGFRQSSFDEFDRDLNSAGTRTGFGAEGSGFQPASLTTTQFTSVPAFDAFPRSSERAMTNLVPAQFSGGGEWQEAGWNDRGGRDWDRGHDRGRDWGGRDRGHDRDWGRGDDWRDSSWDRSRASVSFNYGIGGSWSSYRPPVYCAPTYPVYRPPVYCAPTYPVYRAPTYCPPTYSNWCVPTYSYSFTFSTGGWSGRGWGCR